MKIKSLCSILLLFSLSAFGESLPNRELIFYNPPENIRNAYPEGRLLNGFVVKYSKYPRAIVVDENTDESLESSPNTFEALVQYDYPDRETSFERLDLPIDLDKMKRMLSQLPASPRDEEVIREVEQMSTGLSLINLDPNFGKCGVREFENESFKLNKEDEFHFKRIPKDLENIFQTNKLAASQEISEWVLDQMEDRLRLEQNFGFLEAGVHVDREIYASTDLRGKKYYWVSDKIVFDASINSADVIEALKSKGVTNITPYVNASGNMEILTVRKVEANELGEIPNIRDIKDAIFSKRERVFKEPKSIQELRYSSPLGMLTQVVDLPMTAKKAKAMPPNYLISYGVGREFIAGVKAKTSNDLNPIASAGASVSKGIIIGKSQRIIFQKNESEDQSSNLVQLTYKVEDPRGVTFNAKAGIEFTLLKLGGLKVNTDWDLVSHKNSQLKVGSFEQRFEFDLNHSKGKNAYEKAAIGDFSLAIRFASNDEGVKNLGSKHSFIEKDETVSSSEIIPFVLKKREVAGTLTEAEKKGVSTGKEEYSDFKEIHLKTKETSEDTNYKGKSYSVLRSKDPFNTETKSYNIETNFSTDTENNSSDFSMTIERSFKDNKVKPAEYYDYKQVIDRMIGEDQIPYSPLNRPDGLVKRKLDLGKGEFGYKLDLDEKSIDHITNLTPEEFWQHLEFAFNRRPGEWTEEMSVKDHYRKIFEGNLIKILKSPLELLQLKTKFGESYVSALKFYSEWLEARKVKSTREQQEKLADFFYDRKFSNEVFSFLRSSLDGQSFKYKIWSNTEASGEYYKEGEGIFKKKIESKRSWAKADVKNVEILTSQTNTPGIAFTSKTKPKYVYVKLKQKSGKLFLNSSTGFVISPDDIGYHDGKVILNLTDDEGRKYFSKNKDVEIEFWPSWDGVSWDNKNFIEIKK